MIPHSLLLSKESPNEESSYINEFEYTFDTVSGLELLFSNLEHERYHLVIIDLDSINESEILGTLTKLKSKYHEIPVILSSSTYSWDKVIEFLKEHQAYDFISKPIEKNRFKISIDRAFEYLQLKNKSESIREGENRLYKSMIEIFDWKKSLIKKDAENITADLIHQMNISLFQGSGIGTLMSVVSVLLSKSVLDETGTNYIIKKQVLDLLHENYDAAKSMFDSMSISQSVINEAKEVIEFKETAFLIQILELEIEFLNEATKLKNQKISLSAIPSSVRSNRIRCDESKMHYVIREILINALKYSAENDTIYVLFFHKENYLELKIINPAYPNDDGTIGIVDKNETLVFEPFFRISSVVDDSYAKYEQFRFGLGLSLVKKIIDLHKANVQIFTIENNIRNDKSKDVCLTIRFPITT